MGKENDFERRFGQLLDSVGIEFSRNPVVRTDKPVKDKDGYWKKTVTTPDFLIKYPCGKNINEIYVEVTENNGSGNHKRSQHRVIYKAGLQGQYIVVHGSMIISAEGIEDLKDRKRFIKMNLGL